MPSSEKFAPSDPLAQVEVLLQVAERLQALADAARNEAKAALRIARLQTQTQRQN